MFPGLLRAGGFGGTAAPNVPAPSADTQAPFSIPRVISVPGVGYIDHTCYPTADIAFGAEPVEGVNDYDFDIDGSIQVFNADELNDLSLPTIAGVGGATTSGSYSGRVLTLQSNGMGYDTGASDQFGFAYWDVTDFRYLYMEIASVSIIGGSPHSYAPIGPMIRKGSGVGAQFLAANFWRTADGIGGDWKGRSIADADYNLHPGTFTGNGSYGGILIEKDGTNVIVRIKRGTSWLLLGNANLTWLTGPYRIGANIATLVSGATMSAQITALFYAADDAYTVRQTTALNNRTFRARARDNAVTPNVTPWSETLTTSPLTEEPGGEDIKWRQGAYIEKQGLIPLASYTAGWTEIYGIMDQIAGHAGVRGFAAPITWALLEKTEGVYDFTEIDMLITACRARGLKLSLEWWAQTFHGELPTVPGTPQSTNTPTWPDWLIDDYSGVTASGGPGGGTLYTAIWRAPIMAKLIACYNALGDHCDSINEVELFHTSEWAMSFNNDFTDYSTLDPLTDDLLEQVPSHWTHTTILAHLNFYGLSTNTGGSPPLYTVQPLIDKQEKAVAEGWGLAGPDMINYGQPIDGSAVCRGLGIVNYGSYRVNWGTNDRRGQCAIAFANQWSNYALANTTLELIIYSRDEEQNTHMSWTAGSVDAARNLTTFLSTMDSIDGDCVALGCPSSYGGLCSNV